MVDHHFGGPWTELKLDAVCYYLECYTKALTQKNFDLWYVDVFAGTGDRTNEKLAGGLLERQPVQWVTETLPGSAKRAMNIRPAFRHFIFNESDDRHNKALHALKAANTSLDIEIIDSDANAAVRDVFSRPVWNRGASGSARAAVFLDPYALQVDWATLELLAKTQCVDVWYLFPLQDVTRQLANKRSGVGPKEKKLDRVLGTAWRDLYELPLPRSMAERPVFVPVLSDVTCDCFLRLALLQSTVPTPRMVGGKKRVEGVHGHRVQPRAVDKLSGPIVRSIHILAEPR